MIVKMKKITLLCLLDDQPTALKSLRELGVLHLEHIQKPEGGDIDSDRDSLTQAKIVLATLDAYSNKQSAAHNNPDRIPAQGAEIIAQARALMSQKASLAETHVELIQQEQRLMPYGDFDPKQVEALAAQGVIVRLYHSNKRGALDAPEGTTLTVLRRDSTGQYFVIVGRDKETTIDAKEFPLPERRLSQVLTDRVEAENALADIERKLHDLARDLPVLDNHVAALTQELEYLETHRGMAVHNKLAYLRGFCPVALVDTLLHRAEDQGWGLVIEEPAQDDMVPTLVQTPAWVRPIKALFEMIDVLPGYKEIDASVAFLLFFSIFFGILVGDAGYGVLYLLLTLFARRRWPEAPAYPFGLLKILSISTILWGIITGNYFGCGITTLDRLFRIEWLMNERNLFIFCFLMGTVHLTIAHLWRAIVNIRNTRAIAQAGWVLLTWCMFFMAKYLVLGESGPKFMLYLFIAGMAMILLDIFARFKEAWTDLTTLAFDVIGSFVDVVSYIRLYAVGMASLAVAQAFNALALGTDGRVEGILATVGAALILFLGHALNMVLCIMSVLVHGVRLNTLEFSGHIGLEWGGFPYRPFADRLKKKEHINIQE